MWFCKKNIPLCYILNLLILIAKYCTLVIDCNPMNIYHSFILLGTLLLVFDHLTGHIDVLSSIIFGKLHVFCQKIHFWSNFKFGIFHILNQHKICNILHMRFIIWTQIFLHMSGATSYKPRVIHPLPHQSAYPSTPKTCIHDSASSS